MLTAKENTMKKNFLRICVALLGITLVACLDDDKYALDPDGSQNIIEFYDVSVPTSPSGSIYPVWTASTEVAPSFTLEQTISYSGPNSNNKDIELTLGVDPTALDAYNTQMTAGLNGNAPLGGSTYELMPDANFDLDQTTVTIKKGEKKATVSITLYPDQFDLSKSYIVPLRITSSSDGVLSEHFSVALLAVVVKNIYDGFYKVLDGGIIRNSGTGPDPVLGGDYVNGLEMGFTTINGTTSGIVPLWKDGSGVGGVTGTQVAVNAGTNACTVTCSTNASLKNTPATINQYDPVTKTFILNFDWGAAPSTRIIYDLTLEYDRPR